MNQEQNNVNCPNCGTEIDVSAILHSQVESSLKKGYEKKLAIEQGKLETLLDKLTEDQNKLEDEMTKQQDAVKSQVKEKLAVREIELKKKLKRDVEEEHSAANKEREEEIKEKTEKLKEFNKTLVEIERLKRQNSEIQDEADSKAAKLLTEKLAQQKETITKEQSDKNELKVKALEKKLDDQIDLATEMKRKYEQGSIQLQGEVQELAIEEWLAKKFPNDQIDEIKKGKNGADCLQHVITAAQINCGAIYYESKNTQKFSNSWISKFKKDMRAKNVHVGVLVTKTMPSDMKRMDVRDGIWICSYEEFKGLCVVLRESVIKMSTALASQENKGDKSLLIYDYLTGNEFKSQLIAIVESHYQMKMDLETEMSSMKRIWKKREKQIDIVGECLSHIRGSIEGIAGTTFQTVRELEYLADDADEQNNESDE